MYSLPSEDREVAGRTFTITKLTATEARKVQLILAKVLGPALGALGNKGLSEGAIATAIEKAAGSLSEDDIQKVIGILSKSSKVHLDDGKTPLVAQVYDLFFANEGMLLHWQWVGACLSYNFADFLAGMAGLDLASLASMTGK